MENKWQALGALFQSHPWHGVPIGKDAPSVVTAYIEMVPTDTVKYGHIREISDCPPVVIDRLRHYFLTYKQVPDALIPACEITHVYDRTEALEVIRRSQAEAFVNQS